MKKSIIIFTAILGMAAASSAMAALHTKLTINCPVTSGDAVNQLRNFANSYVAGSGVETMQIEDKSRCSRVPFKSTSALPAGITGDLSSYAVAAVNFNITDAANPKITCSYVSQSGLPSFDVSYALLNGFGASVDSSTADSITLSLPVGRTA